MNRTNTLVCVWRAYNSCNLSCHFCGYAKDLHNPALKAGTDEIIRVARLLSDLQKFQGTKVHLSFLGGEPLLWKDLLKILPELKSVYNLNLGITSNATPLACSEVRKNILQNIDLLTISVDGAADFHDIVRGEAGLFAKAREAISNLRKEEGTKKLHIRINTVLMNKNITNFAQFCEQISSWGINSISFNQLGGRDRPEFFPENKLDYNCFESFKDSFPKLKNTLKKKEISLLGSKKYLGRITSTIKAQAISLEDCKAGEDFIFIDESGRISACSFTSSDFRFKTSDLKSYKDILEMQSRMSLVQRSSGFSACKDCCSTQKFGKYEDDKLFDSIRL